VSEYAIHTQDTSELLRDTINQLDTETVTAGQLINALEQRSFGGMIILLSVLGLIPGVSFVAGFVIIALAVQIIRGRESPILPALIVSRAFNVNKLRSVAQRPLHIIAVLENFVKPRWPWILTPTMTRFSGFIILCLAVAMISPLPLSNILPALALFPIALGLLEKDGLATMLGWLASIVAISVGIFMIFAAIELTGWFFPG